MDSCEYIELFYNRTYEKLVNKQILDDKNYIVPRQQLINYVKEIVNIPYINYIEHIKKTTLEKKVEAKDVTQFNSFSSCEIEMCNALLWSNNPGCKYLDIGRFFPNNVIYKNDNAYKRYGESHIIAAAQLGLAFEYYDYWHLSCLGYMYPDLEETIRRKLLARTITRNWLYQKMLIDILDHDINPEHYIDTLSASLVKRRLRNVCAFFEICITACKEENIKTYDLIKGSETHNALTSFQLPANTSKKLRSYLYNFDYRTLSNETTLELIKKYQKGDQNALDILVKGNMRLVVNIANTYKKEGVDYEDLIQEGTLGLIIAIDHINIYYGSDFINYANWWILQRIQLSLNRLPYLITIPSKALALHKKLWDYYEKFELEHGYPPLINDIDVFEEDELTIIESICQLPSELNDIVIPSDDIDAFESDMNPIEDFIRNDYNKVFCAKLFNFLNKRETSIIKAYFGIDEAEK